MAVLKPADVLGALRAVQMQENERDIVSLGYVKNVVVQAEKTSFDLHLPMAEGAERNRLIVEARSAVEALEGAGVVEVNAITSPQEEAPGAREPLLKGVKNVVAVASGKGGVGKSTVSANLALALEATGATVGLLDADMYGPSMPTMFKVHGPPEGVQENKVIPVECQGIHLMSVGFLADEGLPVIWRGPMVSNMLQMLLGQVAWPELDYLIIDLPPGTGDAQLTLCQAVPLSGAVIVTTPQDISLIDARRGLEMFKRMNVPVLGLVETMSGFTCSHCGEVTHIFRAGGGDRIAREIGIPLLASIPLDPEVVVSGDEGEPIVARNPDAVAARAFVEATGAVVRRLAALKAEGPNRPDNDMNLNW